MSYCTVDDVSELISGTLWEPGPSSDPTSDEVTDDIIPRIDAEIDACLGALYETPITDAGALTIVRAISARMTAIAVWGTAFTSQTGDASYPKDWDEGGRKLLQSLAAGKAVLSGATPIGESSPGDSGAPDMTMRTIEDDPLQDVDMTQAFPPGQVF